MSNFLEKDETDRWNTIPPVPSEKIKNVNCYKFALYAIEEITWQEMISDPAEPKEAGTDFTFGERIRLISDMPYIFIKNENELKTFAGKSCEVGKIYIGQILDAQTNEMAHSFIVKRVAVDEYICFDKLGFKYPFAVCDLNTILNFVNKDGEQSNKNQKWRFVAFPRMS